MYIKIHLIINNEIFNKQRVFYYEGLEFAGMINKNNNTLELNTLNPPIISNDDFILITGHVAGNDISFIIYNHSIYTHSTEHTREVHYPIHSLFIGECFKDFNQIKFKNISIKINNIRITMRNLTSLYHSKYQLLICFLSQPFYTIV